MSVFTAAEIAYLRSQSLGRLATAGRNGQPHVVPVTFRYNESLDAIEIGGLRFGQTKKFRDAQSNPRVAFVVDDAGPRRGRGIEIRGRAQALQTGGQEIMARFSPEMVRITPRRIVSWGIEGEGFTANARSVR